MATIAARTCSLILRSRGSGRAGPGVVNTWLLAAKLWLPCDDAPDARRYRGWPRRSGPSTIRSAHRSGLYRHLLRPNRATGIADWDFYLAFNILRAGGDLLRHQAASSARHRKKRRGKAARASVATARGTGAFRPLDWRPPVPVILCGGDWRCGPLSISGTGHNRFRHHGATQSDLALGPDHGARLRTFLSVGRFDPHPRV